MGRLPVSTLKPKVILKVFIEQYICMEGERDTQIYGNNTAGVKL